LNEHPTRPFRVLVVEDEYLVALMLEECLHELGVVVVGPAHTIEEGISLARNELLDGAILDVNVRGACIDPVAEVLSARDVPFVLATGYSGDFLDRWKGASVLPKPYSQSDVARAVDTFRAGV
jgi:CheY-like chemotaxis protein